MSKAEPETRSLAIGGEDRLIFRTNGGSVVAGLDYSLLSKELCTSGLMAASDGAAEA